MIYSPLPIIPGTPVFPSPFKKQHLQITIRSWNARTLLNELTKQDNVFIETHYTLKTESQANDFETGPDGIELVELVNCASKVLKTEKSALLLA